MCAYQQQDPPLAGAYYGPSIPPTQAYQQPRSVGCCLLSTLIKVFVVIIVLLGITALVLWLVLRPNYLKVSVESASLTRFNLTSGSTNLQYNMSADISVRNPNRHSGVYYDWLEADAYYRDERFSWVPLNTFYQGPKTTTMVNPLFTGQSVVVLGDYGVGYFNGQKQRGAFNIDLWLNGWIRFSFGPFRTRRYVWRAKCELLLPLAPDGAPRSGAFTWTPCYVSY